MKQKRLALALLAVVIFALGGVLWLVSRSNAAAEQAASAAQEGSIPLSSVAAEDVEQIEVTYQGETLTFLYADGTWTLEQDAEYHLDSAACNTMAAALSALNAKRRFDADPGEDYGLEQPQVVVSVTAAGQTNTFAFGAENPVTGDIYLSWEGQQSLYTVAYNKVSCFCKSKAEWFGSFSPVGLTASEMETVQYTLMDGSAVALAAVSKATETKTDDTDSTEYETVWQLTDQPEALLDEAKVQGILSALSSYVSGQTTGADPAAYGFAQPLVSVRIQSAEKTVDVQYALASDGAYLMVAGDDSVYQVDLDTVNALAYTAEQLKTEE